jgi:hypothetical protein
MLAVLRGLEAMAEAGVEARILSDAASMEMDLLKLPSGR